jgi:translocation and assembly module TamB
MRMFLTVMLILWANLATAQSNEEDRDFITGLIEDTINSESLTVRLINFQGALSSAATADAITVADAEGIWLRLDELIIDWNRSALLSGRVEIEKLSAAKIELIRLPNTNTDMVNLPDAEATPFSLPELPVSINIAEISAEQIILTEALLGEPLTARFEGALKLGDGEGSTSFIIERTDNRVGSFIVDAAYKNVERQLRLFLHATEDNNGIAARILNLPDSPSVKLEITGDAPLDDFVGDIALATDGYDRVTGTVRLKRPSGSIDQDFSVKLEGDLRPLLEDQYDPFFGAATILRVEGTFFGLGGLNLSNIIIAADQAVIRGSARIDANGWPETIDLRGRLGTGNKETVLLPFGDAPTEVSGISLNVQYDATNDDAWKGNFDITSLVREGISIDTLTLSGGGIIVSSGVGALGQFTANLNYAASGLSLANATLTEAIGSEIEGALELSRTEGGPLIVNALTLNGAGIETQGSSLIEGPEERFRTQAGLSLKTADFSRFSELTGVNLAGGGTVDLSGTIQPFDGIFNIEIAAQTNDLTIGIIRADPLLAGTSVLLMGMERDIDGTRLRSINLRNDAVQVTGSAEITSQSTTANFTAKVTNLNLVTPSLSGPATLTADVQTNPHGTIILDAVVIAPQAETLVHGIASPIEGGYNVSTKMVISVDELSVYSELVEQQIGGGLSVSLEGSLTTTTGLVNANVTARTQNLQVGLPTLDSILTGNGRIDADVSLSETGRLRLEAIDVVFPNLTAGGMVTSSGTDTVTNLSLRLRDVSILVSDLSGPLFADITAHQDAVGWSVTGDATGPLGTTAKATGHISNSGHLDLSLTGSAPLALANLYIAPRQINGLARFDLSVNGPADLRSVRGPVTISDARMAVPNLQQAIEDINGTVKLTGGTVHLDIRGTSAEGGILALTGPVDLSPPFQAALTAQLSDIVLRDPTLYRTTANGQVTLKGPLTGGAEIVGNVDLGAVEIQVPSTGVSALGSLPEVTHLGPRMDVRMTLERAGVSSAPLTGRQTRAGPDFPIDLIIRTPSRIFVRGRGLDAELGGQLSLKGSLNSIVPIGRFDLVRGRLSILGQRFELDEGYAQLQGNFTPFLRLVATTEARTGTVVSIIVEGATDDINVRFESVPDLPQDEVLAQLLFGRGISSISPLQAVQLASAVASLAGNGGDGGVVANLRQGLNLDDLDFVTDENGNAGVRAGKYLSQNLYSDITIGSNGTTEINLNVDINQNFTARGSTASDGDTSIGIFFEHDY